MKNYEIVHDVITDFIYNHSDDESQAYEIVQDNLENIKDAILTESRTLEEITDEHGVSNTYAVVNEFIDYLYKGSVDKILDVSSMASLKHEVNVELNSCLRSELVERAASYKWVPQSYMEASELSQRVFGLTKESTEEEITDAEQAIEQIREKAYTASKKQYAYRSQEEVNELFNTLIQDCLQTLESIKDGSNEEDNGSGNNGSDNNGSTADKEAGSLGNLFGTTESLTDIFGNETVNTPSEELWPVDKSNEHEVIMVTEEELEQVASILSSALRANAGGPQNTPYIH